MCKASALQQYAGALSAKITKAKLKLLFSYKEMKKLFYQFIITAICYLALTFITSIIFGEQHFHHGWAIGYPTIYYQLCVDGERQFGFTRFFNAVVNVIVIIFILIVYRYLKNTGR